MLMDKQSFDYGWEYTDTVSLFSNPIIQWQPVTLPHDAAIDRPRSHEYPNDGFGRNQIYNALVRKKMNPL